MSKIELGSSTFESQSWQTVCKNPNIFVITIHNQPSHLQVSFFRMEHLFCRSIASIIDESSVTGRMDFTARFVSSLMQALLWDWVDLGRTCGWTYHLRICCHVFSNYCKVVYKSEPKSLII